MVIKWTGISHTLIVTTGVGKLNVINNEMKKTRDIKENALECYDYLGVQLKPREREQTLRKMEY